MASFEPGEMQRFGWSRARLRLELLKTIQVRSLRAATGALFLTSYAADVIQQFTGPLPHVRVIPHGISDAFRVARSGARTPAATEAIRCVYVSNTDLYKHQWHVVSAIAQLRRAGHRVTLRLVGAGSGWGPALELLERTIAREDPDHAFVEVVGAVPHAEIPSELAKADLFVFASSCENMPNTLVEAMAAGLPIACARRGPMPEILRDAGTYFDPENPSSIAAAVERLVVDLPLRTRLAQQAAQLAREYSWQRCAEETWAFVAEVATGLSARTP
jgi:glycosyltransferase involved in cell wall biosynthesis